MSHELRTPLNAIIGFSQLMNKDHDLNNKQKEFVSIINRSGEHLLSLINDILDLSKIEANKITLNEDKFNFLKMLKTIEEMLVIKAQTKQISLIFNIDQQIPQYVFSDEQKIRQILINLINNAIKFTQKGFVKVDVDLAPDNSFLTKAKPNQKIICFTIEDTGKGIEEEELPKLFRPFEQTKTGKNSNEGTGLGLTISRKFIHLLNGEIQVESDINVGTIFTFNIQVEKIESDHINDDNQQVVIGLNSTTEFIPKVLVVDDVKDNCKLLENILYPLGFQLLTAYNGQEAIAFWQDWHPDLILMDIQMPVMNGYEAIKIIRNKEKNLASNKHGKIIAVTASIFEEEENNIHKFGFDDLIRKPFTENVLLEQLKSHLQLEYIYDDKQGNDNQNITVSINLNDLLKHKTLIKEITHMSIHWREKIIISGNRGSDDELFDLITEVPNDFTLLQEILSRLTNEFLFEEIIALISSVDD